MKKLLLTSLFVLGGTTALQGADLFNQMQSMFGAGAEEAAGAGGGSLDWSPKVSIDKKTIDQKQKQKLDTKTGRVDVEAGGTVAYGEGRVGTQAGQSQTANMSSSNQ